MLFSLSDVQQSNKRFLWHRTKDGSLHKTSRLASVGNHQPQPIFGVKELQTATESCSEAVQRPGGVLPSRSFVHREEENVEEKPVTSDGVLSEVAASSETEDHQFSSSQIALLEACR